MESLSEQMTTIIMAVDSQIEQMEHDLSTVPSVDRPALQKSLDELKTARAVVVEFDYQEDNEGQVVIYTGIYEESEEDPLERYIQGGASAAPELW